MSDTSYTDFTGPAVDATWLNDVNNVTYRLLGTSTGPGGAAPTTAAQILQNLGANSTYAPISGSTAYAPISGSTAYAPISGSAVYAPLVSPVFPGPVSVGVAASGTSDAPQIQQTYGAGSSSLPTSYNSTQRPFGTYFTNNTGRPLDVRVQVNISTGGEATLTMQLGAVLMNLDILSAPSASTYYILKGVVPPGVQYSVQTLGTVTFQTWTEW